MALTPTTVVGNLTSDPELRFTTNGKAQLKFSVAVNENYTDNSGEKVEKTSFFNIVAWGYTAENAANILEKGMKVIIVGTLEQRSWDDEQSGQKRSVVEIRALEIGASCGSLESVTRRRSQGGDSSSSQSGQQKQGPKRTKQTVPAEEPF